jgi:Icc-related predicted phosphoesterase
MSTIITLISDTHANHDSVEIAPSDILIVAGDYCCRNTEAEFHDFISWVIKQPVNEILMVSGNHDNFPYRHREQFLEIIEKNNIIYLENSSATISGIRFWGSPVIVPIMEGFRKRNQLDEVERKKIWDTIPMDTDILVTHSPPYGIHDLVRGEHCGCKALLEKVMEIKPRYHLFGHIHQAYGESEMNGIIFKNGTLAGDDTQRIMNKPFRFAF